MSKQLQLFPTSETIYDREGVSVKRLNHRTVGENIYEYQVFSGSKSISFSKQPLLVLDHLKALFK